MTENDKDNDNVRNIYEKPEEGSQVPESEDPEDGAEEVSEDVPKEDAPKRDPQRFIQLNRLHAAEAQLAGLKVQEAENRIRQANRELEQAQKDLKQAQKDHREAQMEGQQAADRILKEMALSSQNVINVDNKVVVPPKGQEFVVFLND